MPPRSMSWTEGGSGAMVTEAARNWLVGNVCMVGDVVTELSTTIGLKLES